MPRPTISAGMAQGLANLAISRGADASALAAMSGLDLGALHDHDRRLPLADYLALMRAAQSLCDEPALGLHYGESVDLSEVSIVGLICHASETMLHAFAQMNRYGRLVVEYDGVQAGDRFGLERSGEQLWLVDRWPSPEGFPELAETSFARMVCGTRQFGTTPFVLEVHFTHDRPSYAPEYDRIFRAPVVFGSDRNAMRIDAAWLTHRVAVTPRYAFGVLSAHAEALLAKLERDETVRALVERALLSVLHTGELGVDAIASHLGYSRQTLHRRLKAEGVSFSSVLDDLRAAMAQHYLTGRRTTVKETAYLVGFSEPAAFSRAFKRWTGRSPSEFRADGAAPSSPVSTTP